VFLREPPFEADLPADFTAERPVAFLGDPSRHCPCGDSSRLQQKHGAGVHKCRRHSRGFARARRRHENHRAALRQVRAHVLDVWSITSGGSGSVGVSLLFSYNHEATRRSSKEHEDPRKTPLRHHGLNPQGTTAVDSCQSKARASDDRRWTAIHNLQSALCIVFLCGLRQRASAGWAPALRRRRAGERKGSTQDPPEPRGLVIDPFLSSSVGRDAANKADAQSAALW
jgi:hypothetical protein